MEQGILPSALGTARPSDDSANGHRAGFREVVRVGNAHADRHFRGSARPTPGLAGALPVPGVMQYLVGAVIMAWMLAAIIALPAGGDDPPDRKWGPFRGQVVDADTGRPIAGATALVVWLWTPLGRSAPSFYDSRAAVTASDGIFEVPKRTPALIGPLIDDPLIGYAAPGYALARIVTAADGLEVAHLTKLERLTASELSRHRARQGHVGWIPEGARSALMEAVNGERRRLGLGPVDGFQLAAGADRLQPSRWGLTLISEPARAGSAAPAEARPASIPPGIP